MATSTDSASSQGECVVCGQETSSRCSECAKFGTDWMYFCSREHQKLIWKVHKRVCGKASNPFHYPLISEAEAQFFAEISQKPSPDDDGVVRSWLDIVMGGIKPEDYAKLRSLRGYTRVEAFKMTLFRVGRDPAGGLRPLEFMTQRLQKLRLDSWKAQIRLAQTESGGRWRLWIEVAPEKSSSNPFGHLAHLLEDVQIPEFNENDKVYTSWWSRFHHLTLIRIAIASLLFDNPSDENTAFVEYTRRAVDEFVESTPSEVMDVVESYLRDGNTVGPT